MLTLLAAILCTGPFTHCKNPPRDANKPYIFARSHPMPKKCLNPDGSIKTITFKTAYGYRRVRDCRVDHVCALVCGGVDDIFNMQWQTYKESKVKDLIEGTQCEKFCNAKNWKGCR